MRTNTLGLALGASILLSSCIINNKTTHIISTPQDADKVATISPTLGGKLFTSAWIQRSAEYKALCQQAYNIATLRLDAATASPLQAGEKPWAIVTDIDETMVDNSANSVHQALRGEDYTDPSWDEWCDRAEAIPLSGAVEFFRRADSLGVDIYYISNRSETNRAGTLKNLQRYGFPQANNEHLMLRVNGSDKTSRREQVLQTHRILMLLGDNLGDFDHLFDVADENQRNEGVKRFAQEFGDRFIVLPNPNYGTWEKAMNGGYPPLPAKDKKLPTLLRTY